MFVAKNQFYVFLACVAFGVALAVLFVLVRLLRRLIRINYLLNIIDLLFLTFSSLLFSYYSYKFSFPNFRPYMLLGVFSGFFAYLKSLHIILAKILKKFYNIVIRKVPKSRRVKNDK